MLFAKDTERDIPYDPEPIGRYNAAPGAKVLLLSERDEHLHLSPVFWGHTPEWRDKPPPINTRVETVAASRISEPLWQHGRVICFTDDWFEWRKGGDRKQPYFIYRADGQPVFMAAIGSTPLECGDKAEGFLTVTTAAGQGPIDTHDHRPLVLLPEVVREWMQQDTGGKEVSETTASGCVSANQFSWYPVSHAVSNIESQGTELI